MELEKIAIKTLSYDPNNARKHSAKNLKAICGSLKKFGQQKPIVVDKNGIVVAGNGTLEAALELEWTEIYATRTELVGDEAKAFALADNRTSELASWDLDLLNDQLFELKQSEFELEDIGFKISDVDVDGYNRRHGIEDDGSADEVPDVAENIHKVERGHIWQLGEHRLMCGDSTDKGDVERLMGGVKADMVFTDPPYGINLDTDWSGAKNKKGAAGGKYSKVIGDSEDYDPRFILEYFSYCKDIFLWGGDYFAKHVPTNGSWVVWDKNSGTDGAHIGLIDGIIGAAFELCWSKSKHQRLIVRVGSLKAGGLKLLKEERHHPTQKPVKLAEWFFERWGKGLTNVVDLFLGSGSTLIACEKTNRKCYGMEIDEHYCSVVIERWQNFTGEKATRG